MRHAVVFSLGVLAVVAGATPSQAQEVPSRLAVDLSGGYASFVDEAPIHHGTVGGGVRWRLTPRLSVGPEFVFMKGPAGDRDVFVTGKLIVDFLPRRLVSPYVVADGGAMLHADQFYNGSYWSREGAISGGGGVRIDVSPRVSISPEFRIGWEPHLRLGAVVTWRP